MIEKYRYPFRFYFFSAAIPWLFWLTAAFLSWQEKAGEYGTYIAVLGIAGLCCPLLVAAYYIQKDNATVSDVLGRVFNFGSTRAIYLLIAVFLMPVSILLAMAISVLFGYDANQFVITGHATFTSGVLPVWFILIFAPVLEELAWHSYGTDCLRQKFSLFATSMIFGVYWTLWHLPLGLIQGYYHSNLVLEGAIYSINFLLSLFPFVLLMNWLYYKTNRNILVAVVLHMGANVFNEIFATHPDSKVIQTGLLCVLTVYLLVKDREFFFDRAYDEAEVANL
ncbi:MAG: CPBP family intramembrane glutamic endopeptidase [Gammaproteobacteria bacterium]